MRADPPRPILVAPRRDKIEHLDRLARGCAAPGGWISPPIEAPLRIRVADTVILALVGIAFIAGMGWLGWRLIQ